MCPGNALSWVLYAHDNDDSIPPNEGEDIIAPNWVRGCLRYDSDSTDNTNILFLQQSHLWQYHQSIGVWRCPGDKSTSNHGGRDIPRVRTVSMNCFLNGNPSARGAGRWDAPYRNAKKTADLVRPGPSDTWLLLDEREDSINNGLFGLQIVGIDPGLGAWPNLIITPRLITTALERSLSPMDILRFTDGVTLAQFPRSRGACSCSSQCLAQTTKTFAG